MAFFDTFSVALKQKWLDYYQVNRAWLLLHMTADNTVATPDGGKGLFLTSSWELRLPWSRNSSN